LGRLIVAVRFTGVAGFTVIGLAGLKVQIAPEREVASQFALIWMACEEVGVMAAVAVAITPASTLPGEFVMARVKSLPETARDSVSE
jgi:hypothetical protein